MLKQKLNNSNQMMNMNQQPPNNADEISFIIQSNVRCLKSDIASLLKEKCQCFSLNYKPIDFNKTFEENRIYNGAIIKPTEMIYNINFSHKGNMFFVPLDGDCPFKKAIQYYCESGNIENLYQKVINQNLIFLFNSYKLNIYDETPINQIFQNNRNPKIIVNVEGDIIGG